MSAFNLFKNIAVLGVAALLLMGTGSIAKAQEKKRIPKRVLIIFVYKQGLPWVYRIEESMRATVASESSFPIELNFEHADRSRFAEEKYLRKVVDLYRYKYTKRNVDLVLTFGDESTELLLEYSAELFGDIPLVLVTSKTKTLSPDLRRPNMMQLTWGWDMENTIALIHKLLPQTKNLFVISGTSTTDRQIKDIASEALRKSHVGWDVQHITDFAASELYEKVTHLPRDSAIYYLTVFRDANGDSFVPRDFLSSFSGKANAPVFGIGDTYLGHGIVGGSLVTAENTGKRFARIAFKLLAGESLSDRELTGKGSQPMFDWRQLKRWSIDEERLPPGSIVKFKEHDFWDNYKAQIIGALLLFFLQGLVILYLLHQRKIRRQAEKETLLLAGKLLNAQESERARIARELHDDITQRLAVLNIEVDNLEIKYQSLAEPLREKLRQLGADLGELSSDIHMISRQLHPSILYDLGLIKAIESECNNFTRLRGLSPTLDLDNNIKNSSKEIDLCIYRILQEGLRNIGKHARATDIQVRLYQKNKTVYFFLKDNGIGFDPALAKERVGIGLASMAERARLINGDLSIESRPGKGTVIKFEISVTPRHR